MVTSGERERGKGRYRMGDLQAHTVMCKINYKDLFYSPRNITNTLS